MTCCKCHDKFYDFGAQTLGSAMCMKCLIGMANRKESPKDEHGMYTEPPDESPIPGPCSNCGDPSHWRPDCPELRPTPTTWTPRLLEEAIAAVSGARNKDYGNPWENHQRTAELIEWWLKHAKGVEVIITDLDVCMINILQKASRLSHDPEHWDGWKDIAGYAGNAGVCMDVHDGKIKVSGVPQDEIGEL